MDFRIRYTILACLTGMTAGSPLAQGTWPGCADIEDAQFKVSRLVSRASHLIEEPMKMAFDLVAQPGEDAADKVDIYFTERKGKLRKYDSRTKTVKTLAQFNLTIPNTSSDGLMGIALDPQFKNNHHVYLYYTYSGSGETSWRVSRFTLDAAHEQLDMASEKVVLKVTPMQIGAQHPGGAIQFDAYGDLWITTGDNHSPSSGNGFYIHTSANTNDLRGKVLRITPKPDGTYSIPQGNLFEEGTPKTRPEIYIMGARNPYSLSLDPVRRWAAFGDVGPDGMTMDGTPMNQAGSQDRTEEYNLATAAGNFGYPFFVGNNFQLKTGIDAENPVIPSGTDWKGAQPGLETLPRAVPAIKAYRKSCAVTGPIYRYNGDLNSSIKFPPHFHRRWFTTDFNAAQGNPINLYTLNETGTSILNEELVLRGVTLYQPLDMQFGPDGALYVINYAGYRTATSATGIVRIEYTGSCKPAEPKLETPSGVLAHGEPARHGPRLNIFQGRALSIEIATAGDFTLEIRDLLGRPVGTRKGRGDSRLLLNEVREPGVYFLQVTSPEGKVSRKIVQR